MTKTKTTPTKAPKARKISKKEAKRRLEASRELLRQDRVARLNTWVGNSW